MDEPSFLKWLDELFTITGFGFFWFGLLAVWGGTANYLSRIKDSDTAFSIMELVGEWTISAFAGIITAYVCYEMEFSFYMTAAMSGIAGHMGGRGISLVEDWISMLAKKRFGR